MRASPYLICAFASAVALSACGSEPSCPSGSVKNKKGVCVSESESEATMDGGQVSSDGDEATDEERDASTQGDACVKAEETCNGLDDDCDGNVDEDLTGESFIDRDKDGYGTGDAVDGCGGVGYASKSGDCDDGNDARSPGAAEVCNGVDDNCDGVVDEGVRVTLYLDEDGDGHGLASDSDVYCAGQVVPNRVPSNADCDDKCPTCSPDNTQETLCDGKDDDCDGELDEGVDQLFEADCDKDGFAAESAELARACVSPATGPAACAQGGWTAPGGLRDCNDGRADLNPSAAEVCDYIDNNCNKVVDELPGSTQDNGLYITFRPDVDGDGYQQSATERRCEPANAHWVPINDKPLDCADSDPKAFPGSNHQDFVMVTGTQSYDYNCDQQSEFVDPVETCVDAWFTIAGKSTWIEGSPCSHAASKCWAPSRTCGASELRTCSSFQGNPVVVKTTSYPLCR